MYTAMTVPGPGGSGQARSAQAPSSVAGDVDQVFGRWPT